MSAIINILYNYFFEYLLKVLKNLNLKVVMHSNLLIQYLDYYKLKLFYNDLLTYLKLLVKIILY